MSRVSGFAVSSDEFAHPPTYGQQYANVYYLRLDRLGPQIIPPKSWHAPRARRVLDLVPGREMWCVGTVVRVMSKRPDILADLRSINHGISPPVHENYASPDDKIFVEDEHGRVQIEGTADMVALLVTGCVVGVLGTQDSLGTFYAEGVCFPKPLDPPVPPSQPGVGKVALISGLLLDEDEHEGITHQLLIDFLAGSIAPELSAQIQRVMICGDSLVEPKEELIGTRVLRPKTRAASLDALDTYMAQVAAYVPVHLMPGSSDPAPGVMLPQQPFHPALFSRCRPLIRSGRMKLETNPQKIVCDDTVKVLGTSGQPLRDLSKYSTDSKLSTLDLMELTLQWHHLAPTVPDTYWTYPFPDRDPLVIDETPHVYFSGNADEFATDVRGGVRLVSVPRFRDSGVIVLLDLATLEASTVELST